MILIRTAALLLEITGLNRPTLRKYHHCINFAVTDNAPSVIVALLSQLKSFHLILIHHHHLLLYSTSTILHARTERRSRREWKESDLALNTPAALYNKSFATMTV